MQVRTLVRSVILLLSVLAFCSALALASDYNGVVAYGDSIIDNGNLFKVVGQPQPPYWNGRFSNGPVSVEYLAQYLAAPLTDYAYGGATTGIGDTVDGGTQTKLGALGLPGDMTQYASTVGSITPDQAAHSLFMVFAGLGNDLSSNGLSTHTADVAAQNILTIVAGLQAAGVQHILVPGAPDIGLTPKFAKNGLGTIGTQISAYFNAELVAGLQGKGVTYFDTFALTDDVVKNPAKYGLVNVTDGCYDGVNVCANPDQYLFWDQTHTTTYANRVLGADFYQAVTPEPASLIMLGTGVVGVFGYIRRRIA